MEASKRFSKDNKIEKGKKGKRENLQKQQQQKSHKLTIKAFAFNLTASSTDSCDVIVY